MSRFRLLMGYATGALAALLATGALAVGWQYREWTKTPEYFDMPSLSPGGSPIRMRKGSDGKWYGAPASSDEKPKPDLPADFVFYNVGGRYMEGRTFIAVLGAISALLAATAAYLLRQPRPEIHQE